MTPKFIVLSLLAATAYGSGGYSSFSYGVSDPNTGDVKDQHEKRVGDNVVGKYSILESDGTKRVVEYTANDASGFNAVVKKEPGVAGPTAATALLHSAALAGAAPAVHPAPLNAGLTYGAPLDGHYTYSATLGKQFTSHAFAQPGVISNSLVSTGAHGPVANSFTPQGNIAHGFVNPAHGLGNSAFSGYSGAGYTNSHAGSVPSPLSGHFSGSSAPAISTYSHSIVHDIPRPYSGPYASVSGYGAYGSYGQGAPGFANPTAADSPLVHSSPLANGWTSPLTNSANVWMSPDANNANVWTTPLGSGANDWPSFATNGHRLKW